MSESESERKECGVCVRDSVCVVVWTVGHTCMSVCEKRQFSLRLSFFARVSKLSKRALVCTGYLLWTHRVDACT